MKTNRKEEGYYRLDAGDKNTTKIFIGYNDCSYRTEYVRPDDAEDRLKEIYARESSVIYLYLQERPITKHSREVYKDLTSMFIKKLEVEAESYINHLALGLTGRGLSLGDRLRDQKNSFDKLLELRRWIGAKHSSGFSYQECYRRRLLP